MQVGNRNYRGLLKFGIKEHMEALYEEGLLYLNTFTYFKELEYNGDGRADIYEGVTEYYSGEGFDNLNLTISFGEEEHILSRANGTLGVAFTDRPPEFSHLYSMTSIDVNWALKQDKLIDERNFAKNKDYVVIVYDTVKFLDKLTNYLVTNGYTSKRGFIEYINENSYSGEMGCFRKFSSYSHQNEWRLALKCHNILDPIKITLGSLEGIAIPPKDKKDFYDMKIRIGNRELSNKSLYTKVTT